MRDTEDAYGHAMLDYFEGRGGWEVVESADGDVRLGAGPELYLAPFRRWRSAERRAMRFVRGKVLDIGCGAGRFALHLQERGLEVTAVDASPRAIEVCERRGVRAASVLAIEDLDQLRERFDTVLLLGGNLGLFGSRAGIVDGLRRLAGLTTDRGRLLAASRDPVPSAYPSDLATAEGSLRPGPWEPGQRRIRIRYRQYATPFFSYLRISDGDLGALLGGTQWRCTRVLHGAAGLYVAVLDKRRPRARTDPEQPLERQGE